MTSMSSTQNKDLLDVQYKLKPKQWEEEKKNYKRTVLEDQVLCIHNLLKADLSSLRVPRDFDRRLLPRIKRYLIDGSNTLLQSLRQIGHYVRTLSLIESWCVFFLLKESQKLSLNRHRAGEEHMR